MHRAHFLVGPTAVGKTAVAHLLAERTGWPILSADALQVYRHMDIGTAKPSAEERRRHRYAGIDLVDPAESFDLARYLDHVRALPDGDWLVVGGSGLYVRALLEGLDAQPPADPELRAQAEALLSERGVGALQDWLRRTNPEALAALADPRNPRRLIRALERGAAAGPARARVTATLVGLAMDRAALGERIARRAGMMYGQGLVEEARGILSRFGALSPTAAQAIGYAEAVAVVRGALTREEALMRTVVRTRQFAKRQMTWFRRQAVVDWIEVAEGDEVRRLADEVESRWRQHGSVTLAV